MATATLRNDNDTICTTFTRRAGELRVFFENTVAPRDGYTLSQLDVLEAAIFQARKHMLEDQQDTASTLSVVAPSENETPEARFQKQLRRMQPVPT